MSARNRYYPPIQGELNVEGFSDREYEDFGAPGLHEFEFETEAEAAAEYEGEFEDEAEGFANPVRRIYRDAEMMAHLAKRAGRADSEDEAEAFIGALVPIAANLIPRAAAIVSNNAPAMIRGTVRIARMLRRDPATRELVGALPVVLQRTAQSLADQADNGADIDSGVVASTLGTMTRRVLGASGRTRSMRAVNVFDRRWRQRSGAAGRGFGPGVAGGFRPRQVSSSPVVTRRVRRR